MNRAVPIGRLLLLLAAGLAVVALATGGSPRAESAKDIRYVVVHSPGPGWKPGVPIVEQPGLKEHIDHYRKLHADGKLAMGGPFLDASGGGMMIPEAGLAEAEVRAFAEADPAVKAGLLKAEVRVWMVGMRK